MKTTIIAIFALSCLVASVNVNCADSSGPIDDGITTIGIYADSGAALACVTAAKNMFLWMGYDVEFIYATTVNNEDIQHIDIFYFPGGTSGPYIQDITPEGKEKIRQLIRNGAGYIGTCAGAMFAADTQIWQGTTYATGQLGIFPGTAQGPIPEIFPYPEIGMCQVNLKKPHPITDGQPDLVWIMLYHGPFMKPNPGATIDTVGIYDITGQPALVACEYGDGRIFLTGPHPEWEEDSDRDSVSYFDNYDDFGSDWPLMQGATRWCLHEE
jgi:glutamine amidotransferase-like uncharacterized protein